MYKRSLLSYTAVATIIIFNIQCSTHAFGGTLVSTYKILSDRSIDTIEIIRGGTLKAKRLTLGGNDIPLTLDIHNSLIDGENPDQKAEGELNNTTIKEATNGIRLKGYSSITVNDSSINVTGTGVKLENVTTFDNRLTDVKISGYNGSQINMGVSVNSGILSLTYVTVTQAKNGVFSTGVGQLYITKGEYTVSDTAVKAQGNSTISLQDSVKISGATGLLADGGKIAMEGGRIRGENESVISQNGGHIDLTDVAVTLVPDELKVLSKSETPENEMPANEMNAAIHANRGTVTMTGGSITAPKVAVFLENSESSKDNKNKLENVKISSGKGQAFMDEGIRARTNSTLTLNNVTLSETNNGVWADDHSEITIAGGSFYAKNRGLYATNGSTIKLENSATVTSSDGITLLADGSKSSVIMTGGVVNAKESALLAKDGGYIDLENVLATAEVSGLQLLSLSETHQNNSGSLSDSIDPQSNEIHLTGATLQVQHGTAICIGAFSKENPEKRKNDENNTDPLIGTINLNNSHIRGDVLLGDDLEKDNESLKNKGLLTEKEAQEVQAISNGTFILTADGSTLEGRSKISEDKTVHFDLRNGTIWTLKNSTQDKDNDGKLLDIAQRSRSDISMLDLSDSAIVFSKPTENHYHTLHIGFKKSEQIEPEPSETTEDNKEKSIYNASGNAQIHFNAEWSDGAAVEQQKTDRLLIHGDVSGTTAVYVTGNFDGNNIKKNTSIPNNIRGLSLIQVSGKAGEDSFKLVNGYTTKNGSPNMYTLYAYGPESSHGKANTEQSLFEEKDYSFWDFRLQPEFLFPKPGSKPNVHAVVPQMASYLIMPSALFYTGLTDMTKQNALLADMRASSLGKTEQRKNAFFLYTYGSTGTLYSKSGPRKYGYRGANIHSAALQGGVTLALLEGQSTTTSFGLVGTYNKLSFTPKDMKDASKSTVNKWSLTAYGSLQHNNGFYVDALLSYGILKGDITNAIIGKTAKVKHAKMWSISTTIGKQFATHVAGLTFEPQVQFAYQYLAFKTIEDADKFTVDMNNPHQWLIRIGGRLTKTVLTTEKGRSLSFYGKLNAIKTFGDDKAIHIDKDYQLESMGSFLEGGVGVRAQLSQNISLHGDVNYQQKLQKAGISGASFSGGIRYQF
ncbi:outer membrane autotransporter protein [Bartonella silvatica]|uniref:Outer membrane autotransporter protein n=1 Tax=Bartonella silvatica TaxID=357760 RepID=A0ABV2HHR4_9HYPH